MGGYEKIRELLLYALIPSTEPEFLIGFLEVASRSVDLQGCALITTWGIDISGNKRDRNTNR